MTDLRINYLKAGAARKIVPLFVSLGAAVVGLACGPGQHKASGGHVIQVYYFPIGAQTLTPVTSENIETRGQQYRIESQKDIDRISKILDEAAAPSAATTGFSDKTVRVKLVDLHGQDHNLIAIVENDGFVKRPGGHDGVLSQKGLATLKAFLEGRCK